METLLQKTADKLKKRGFEARVFENANEANAFVKELIGKGESVTWGGSMTIRDMGLTEALKKEGYLTFDRDEIPPSERAAFVREHFFSDWYLMSANALTEEGELLNLDGMGNRVASLIYGPRHVIVIAGANKIVPSLEDAYKRVREIAAPKNAQRFSIQTPCKKTGACANCLSPDTICSQMVYTRTCRPQGRIYVLLVNETLGY